MTTNLSPLDCALRGAFGLALLATPLLNFATAPMHLLGILPLATGLLGHCPIYAVFGISSCRPGSYAHRTDVVMSRHSESVERRDLRANP